MKLLRPASFSSQERRPSLVLRTAATALGLALVAYPHKHASAGGPPDILWSTNAHITAPWSNPPFYGVGSVAFSPDSSLLASGGGDWDTRVKVWRVSDGGLVRALTNAVFRVESVVFSPDGKMLAATGGEYGRFPSPDFRSYNLINLWDTADWNWRGITNAGGLLLVQLAFSHNGRQLAAASGDYFGELVIFEMPEGHELTRYGQNNASYGSLAFSPDDRELATSHFGGLGTEVRNATSGTVRLDLPFIGSVDFSPDGATLMIAEDRSKPPGLADRSIFLVDAATGAVRTNLPHPGSVYTAAFTPDGKTIVSWAGDNKIRFWSLRDYSVFQVYDQETTNVWALAVAPNGRYFAYGRDDGVVVLAQMPLWLTDITRLNNQVRLTWSGGTGRYQLLRTTDLASGVWETVGNPTTETTATVAATNPFEFFRVQTLPQQ